MADQYIQVQPNSTGLKVDASELVVNSNTVERQRMVIADPTVASALVQCFPAGELRVMDEPHQLMYDVFDSGASLDTVNRWNAAVSSGGGAAAAQAGGNLTLGTGTTANGYSYLTSQAKFPTSTPGWIRYAFNVQLEYAITANTYRFWGCANPQGAPSVANPISDGAGFEVSTAGTMYAVVYQGGARTAVATFSSVADNATHNYQCFYRPTNIYWYIDSVLVATSTLAQSALNVDTLPVCYLAVAGSTGPSSSGVLTSNAMSVSDTAKDAHQLSDGTYPWRKATVSAAGALKVDNSAVTQPVSGTVTANAGTGTFTTSDGNAASQGSATSGQKGFLELGAVTTSAPSYTTAQSSPLSLNTSGGLRVDPSGVTSPVSLASLPALATGSNVIGSAKITDGTSTAACKAASTAAAATDPSLVVNISPNSPAHPVSQSGTWTVQPGNTPNATAWLTSQVPAASGGLTTYKLITAASTNATSVKASAGQLYNVQAFNLNAAPRYLKLYNKASAPTVRHRHARQHVADSAQQLGLRDRDLERLDALDRACLRHHRGHRGRRHNRDSRERSRREPPVQVITSSPR